MIDSAITSFDVGPFRLLRRLGQGATGEVWEAVHREQQVPVALKVLTTPLAREAAFQWIFRAEVRAVGSLDHHCVVQVYDLGRIDDADAAAGHFEAGSPFLVMELVAGRDLSRRVLGWPALRHVLRSLLAALAHAHARGVIHLDLKPANVLVSDDQVKLTDFGVSHALDRESPERDEGSMTGTPNFMAPEQIEGRWRLFGPWTDLYGLGCLAWTLTYGAAPFQRTTVWQTLSAHLGDALPGPPVDAPVPEGFHAWLCRLLAKSPAHRFQRAADAAWALDALGLHVETDIARPPLAVPGAAAPTARGGGGGGAAAHATSTDPTLEMALPSDDGDTLVQPAQPWDEVESADAAPAFSPMPVTVPDCPADWRPVDVTPGADTNVLRGVGLALYGVRVLPVVDRKEARDGLWRMLNEVCEDESARLAVLKGPSGCGKTRLAHWLKERAHELGVAEIMTATHGPQPGPSHGLAQMVARDARATGLERREILRHVEDVVRHHGGSDPAEWLSLAELISPGAAAAEGAGDAALNFSSAAERQLAIIRYVERRCAKRPVILHLDDAQWGLGTLGFVTRLLDRQARRPEPVLVVLTVRDDAIATRPEEQAMLTALCARPVAVTIPVGALPVEHRPALIRTLLGLDGDVARQVEERTAGNPLFAVQMVGDWVARRVLVPGPGGFQLADGEAPRLPDDLHEVWLAGIDKALEGRSEAEGVALEVAAVLGGSPSMSDWLGACRRAGAEGSFGLVERLVDLNLARLLAGNDQVSTLTGASLGWAFVHSMLRESLLRRARETGRWTQLHGACADMQHRRTGRSVLERRGRHLVEAERLDDAVKPLLDGAWESFRTGVLRDVDTLLTLRDDVLTRLGASGDDPRWGRGWLLRCRVARRLGGVGGMTSAGRRLAAAARTHGWTDLLPFGLLEVGCGARAGGDMETADAALVEAVRVAEMSAGQAGGPSAAIGECRRELAAIAMEQGRIDAALKLSAQAAQDLDAAGELEQAGLALLLQSYLITQSGAEANARKVLAKSQARFRRAGSRSGEAKCVAQLGELARHTGQLEAAEAFYRESMALHDAVGDEATWVELNLALTLIAGERFAEARRLLESTVPRLEQLGRLPLVAAVGVKLLACYAGTGDWQTWDMEIGATQQRLADTGFVEQDVAMVAEHAGALAAAAGKHERARTAYDIAAEQLASLGRTAEAERVRSLL